MWSSSPSGAELPEKAPPPVRWCERCLVNADRADALLPGPLDALARRLAPAWRASGLDAGPAAGSGLRQLRPALWVLLAAAVVQSVLHVVDVAFLDLRVDRINADVDGSLDGWMGTLTTGLVAWGAFQLALVCPRVRRPLLVLAALCAFLSLDDMLALHEVVARLALRFQPYGHAGYDLWPAVYLPLLVVVGVLLLRTARTVEVRTGRLVVAGLAALAVAVLLETSAPVLFALGSDHGEPLYESEVTVEEALELLGWGAMAIGLAAAHVDVLLGRAGTLLPGPRTESVPRDERLPAGS